MGYWLAGFGEVVGVDIEPQPNYPFDFCQSDALEYLQEHWMEFDVIHASPPCQFYSEATPPEYRASHPDLIPPTRKLLKNTGKPYVIENVNGARMVLENPIMLCGTMFGLKIQRHRWFEVNPVLPVLLPPCRHDFQPILVTGMSTKKINGKRYQSPVAEKADAIGINWMTEEEMTQAVPPAYTEFIGRQLLQAIAIPPSA